MPAKPLKLKVARPLGGDNFTIVGESGLETPAPNSLGSFATRIPVQAGDVIGFYNPVLMECGRAASVAYDWYSFGGDPAPGTTVAFLDNPPRFQFDIAATLESVADNDGFGDETQDACPTSASTQLDCSPPETTITEGPKDKTKKKKASFEFTSSEAGSSFECTVDGKVFQCASPLVEKVGTGKHNFQVQATDQAGNTDATPASDDWKVKRKKK